MNRITQSQKQTNYEEEGETKNKAGTKQTHRELIAVGAATQKARQQSGNSEPLTGNS